MPQKDPSRTEEPTRKRIRDARNKGNVAKSQELGVAVTILGGLIGLYFWMSFLAKDMMGIFRYFLGTAILTFNPDDASVINMLPWLASELAMMLLPVMFFIGIVVYIAQRAQVGKLWSTKVFKPDLKKLNPINGLKRMFFSLQTLIRLFKSMMKAAVIAMAVYFVVKRELPFFTDLYYVDASGMAAYMLHLGMQMTLYALVPMLVIAAVDLKYTRWDYKEQLKMTKDEVKDERRQQEGDPQIKQKQKQKMMQMAMRRMMQEVPKADVVITNPTHLAIALKYNAMEAPAPVVVAKGADRVAEKIREIARENRIPIRENKPLARALYKQVEIGDMIPEDLYQAVATILAQLWKSKGGNAQPGQGG